MIFAPDCSTRSLMVKFVSTVDVAAVSNCAALLGPGTPLDQLAKRDQLPLPTCHVVCAFAPAAPKITIPANEQRRPFRQFSERRGGLKAAEPHKVGEILATIQPGEGALDCAHCPSFWLWI